MDRFKKVYSQGTISIVEIWVDTETGVNYVFHRDGNAALLFTADFDNQTIFYIAHPVRCAINLHKNIGLIL